MMRNHIVLVASLALTAAGDTWVMKETTGVDDCPSNATPTKVTYTPQDLCYATWSGYEHHSCNGTYYFKKQFAASDTNCSGTPTKTKEVVMGCKKQIRLTCGVTIPRVQVNVYEKAGCNTTASYSFFQPLDQCVTKTSATSTKSTCVDGQLSTKYYKTDNCDESGEMDAEAEAADFYASASSSCKGPDADWGEYIMVASGCSAPSSMLSTHKGKKSVRKHRFLAAAMIQARTRIKSIVKARAVQSSVQTDGAGANDRGSNEL